MNDTLLEIINERQLVSVMNKTKWRELCDAFSELEELSPVVRYKSIAVEKIYGFSTVWWDEMFRDCATFEWLDIDPIKREKRGNLVSDKETDFSEIVAIILKKYHIPYSLEQNYFRVWGYTNQNESPKFV